MADKHWAQKAFSKHKGKMTRKAKAAGESTREFAISHYHSKGTTGREARAAVNINPSWKRAV